MMLISVLFSSSNCPAQQEGLRQATPGAQQEGAPEPQETSTGEEGHSYPEKKTYAKLKGCNTTKGKGQLTTFCICSVVMGAGGAPEGKVALFGAEAAG